LHQHFGLAAPGRLVYNPRGGSMHWRSWSGRLLFILVWAAFAYTGWSTYHHPSLDECYACKRPIHAHSRTVASVNGHQRVFCCPACALSQHEQTGKPVAITQLTSFLTGKALSPDQAYIVRGSRVNMCERTQKGIDADKQPVDLRYDRCAPSLIAFAERDQAIQFTREHGGEVRPFSEIASLAK